MWRMEAVRCFSEVSICKNWYKIWYLHFYKTCDYQMRQAATSTRFNTSETNQAGAGHVITSRSRGKLKRYLNYQSWNKIWYLHFYKTCDYQMTQAAASTGFNSSETNQAGAGHVTTSRSRDKLKRYLNYQSAYGHQLGTMVSHLGSCP